MEISEALGGWFDPLEEALAQLLFPKESAVRCINLAFTRIEA